MKTTYITFAFNIYQSANGTVHTAYTKVIPVCSNCNGYIINGH